MKQKETYTLTELTETMKLPVAADLSLILGSEIPHIVLLIFLGLEGFFRPN